MDKLLEEIPIPKLTGTYSDALRAIGLASLVAEVAGGQVSVTIADEGQDYVIGINPPLHVRPAAARVSVGYPYLLHEKAAAPPKGIFPQPYPYGSEMRKEKIWKKYQDDTNSGNNKRRRNKSAQELAGEPQRPDKRHALMKAINALRSGSESWNNLARAIQTELTVNSGKFLDSVLKRIEGMPEEFPSVELPSIGVLQTFLPTAGKGINRLKPDGAKLDNLKEPWVDWFEEWCKYRGVWYALNARFIGKGGKDLKFMSLLPGTQVEITALRNIADEFVDGGWLTTGRAFTNVKNDVFSVLGLARWLIEHSEFTPVPENRLFRFFKTRIPQKPSPRDVIAGIATAYFKSLGTGKALANTSYLFLPHWFPLTQGTYNEWLAVLDEHRDVLRVLDEEKAEEAHLLATYRNAVSRNDLYEYLDFFADYGRHVMRCLDRGLYIVQFTMSKLEVLIMGLTQELNPHIASLVKDSSFLAIADAIHEATVKAQYWKGQNQQEWNIHYGLAQGWKRAADRGVEFVHELTDFVRLYNEENAKRKEKPGNVRFLRDDIVRADLDKVLEYMTSGKIDSRTLCLLLLAYGFAMTDEERERAQTARNKKQPNPAVAQGKV